MSTKLIFFVIQILINIKIKEYVKIQYYILTFECIHT